ncbi:glycosyltransferase [Methylobacterium sp. NEAU K]|uniref:glycosyltransferase n=1 Tax=Methylobacterium sp. NEAU K TaxID=3064946 RepID=UPI002734D7BF|nr:nucleotide disphospho-sugar-binding domain-containing protein [Methylobacterium sp. NEAU K]MDP4002864.1 glycosyltransferase [Methylobacterium sp. NEAU K]
MLPFIALGHELLARGHGVSLAAPAPFEPMALRAGLAFQPLGSAADYEAVIRQPDLWHPRWGFQLMFDFAVRVAETACLWLGATRARGVDQVVVASPLAWGARLAQELYAIPTATLHVMPFLIESRSDPPRLPGLPLPRILPAALRAYVNQGVDAVAVGPFTLPPLNALRARLGLDPVGRLRHWWNSPTRMLLMFPDWYAAPQADWPAQAVQLGFPLVDRFGDVAAMPPELEAFLSAGDAPIVFTYGSAMRQGADFFETALRICRSMGRRGVLLAPQGGQIPERLPAGVVHLPYAPLSALLPRSAALVHHGGVGTVAQALAAGIPQLVVPVAFDHFDEGRRLKDRTLGATLSRRAFRPARAARVLGRLLADPAVARACGQAKARMAESRDAITEACEHVEELAASEARTESAAHR